jgi:hypothetical protein
VTAAAKQTAQNFVTGLLTDSNQNSGIQAKHIKGSAVATYVTVFERVLWSAIVLHCTGLFRLRRIRVLLRDVSLRRAG